jgi:hypothetical protein
MSVQSHNHVWEEKRWYIAPFYLSGVDSSEENGSTRRYNERSRYPYKVEYNMIFKYYQGLWRSWFDLNVC